MCSRCRWRERPRSTPWREGARSLRHLSLPCGRPSGWIGPAPGREQSHHPNLLFSRPHTADPHLAAQALAKCWPGPRLRPAGVIAAAIRAVEGCSMLLLLLLLHLRAAGLAQAVGVHPVAGGDRCLNLSSALPSLVNVSKLVLAKLLADREGRSRGGGAILAPTTPGGTEVTRCRAPKRAPPLCAATAPEMRALLGTGDGRSPNCMRSQITWLPWLTSRRAGFVIPRSTTTGPVSPVQSSPQRRRRRRLPCP